MRSPAPPKKKRARFPAQDVFQALARHWGPQRWWPARSRTEMIIGAILTQNTAWLNVKKALARLRAAHALRFDRIHHARIQEVEHWIHPAGTYRVKAQRLRAFTDFLYREADGSLDRLFRRPTAALREQLLAVPGIGPETADCILLYAARRPVFVIDAYTRRFMERHGWSKGGVRYAELADVFIRGLPRDTALFNEYHALIDRLGKEHCRARPACTGCPLRPWLGRKDPVS